MKSLSRRWLLNSFLAAPVIIRTPGLLMPIKRIHPARLVPGTPLVTIAELERKNREFWGLTSRNLAPHAYDPPRIIWTNSGAIPTLRAGVPTQPPAQLKVDEAWHRERQNRLRTIVEATFDMNGKTLPPEWGHRLTPFCADRIEAKRRYEMLVRRDAA